MESYGSKEVCPKCGSPGLKTWDELDRDEEIIAKVLPASATVPQAEREKHRFCTRCWFETDERGKELT
jgi:hypothetical protein